MTAATTAELTIPAEVWGRADDGTRWTAADRLEPGDAVVGVGVAGDGEPATGRRGKATSHTQPVWFVTQGSKIYVLTGPGEQFVRVDQSPVHL